jgi:hypothetical protein
MAKLHNCDGCGKMRRDLIACGRDANGEADAPDLCFICRKEMNRNRFYSKKMNRYMDYGYFVYPQY